jgi:hypothetical protein
MLRGARATLKGAISEGGDLGERVGGTPARARRRKAFRREGGQLQEGAGGGVFCGRACLAPADSWIGVVEEGQRDEGTKIGAE